MAAVMGLAACDRAAEKETGAAPAAEGASAVLAEQARKFRRVQKLPACGGLLSEPAVCETAARDAERLGLTLADGSTPVAVLELAFTSARSAAAAVKALRFEYLRVAGGEQARGTGSAWVPPRSAPAAPAESAHGHRSLLPPAPGASARRPPHEAHRESHAGPHGLEAPRTGGTPVSPGSSSAGLLVAASAGAPMRYENPFAEPIDAYRGVELRALRLVAALLLRGDPSLRARALEETERYYRDLPDSPRAPFEEPLLLLAREEGIRSRLERVVRAVPAPASALPPAASAPASP